MKSKNYRVTEALQQALDITAKFSDDPSLAFEVLKSSVQGIITFMAHDQINAQPLCATIRSKSKYACQLKDLPADQQIFPVSIRADNGGWCVIGGPGGQYRLTDVHLYALHNTQLVRIN